MHAIDYWLACLPQRPTSTGRNKLGTSPYAKNYGKADDVYQPTKQVRRRPSCNWNSKRTPHIIPKHTLNASNQNKTLLPHNKSHFHRLRNSRHSHPRRPVCLSHQNSPVTVQKRAIHWTLRPALNATITKTTSPTNVRVNSHERLQSLLTTTK